MIDIRAGIVLDNEAGLRSKLSNGVEALIDASKKVEGSGESDLSEAQKVQFDIARWYLLFSWISLIEMHTQV